MAADHPDLKVWRELAAALECSLEEVCRIGKKEREHLMRVMDLPKHEDTDQEDDIEELTSSEDEGNLGYAAPFPGQPAKPVVKESNIMRVATKRRGEVKVKETSSKRTKLDNIAEENGDNQSSSNNDENDNNPEDKTSKVNFVNMLEASCRDMESPDTIPSIKSSRFPGSGLQKIFTLLSLENISSQAHRRSRLLQQHLSQEEDDKLAVLRERLRRPPLSTISSEVVLDKVHYVKRRGLLSSGVVKSSSPWIQLATIYEAVEKHKNPEIIGNMVINEPWSKEMQEILDAEMAVKLAADLEAGETRLSTRNQVTMAWGTGVYPKNFLGFCRSHIFTDLDYADPLFLCRPVF